MWSNIRLLFVKEIIGAVRDRRTMLLTVFFPLVFYPLILLVIGRFTAAERTQIEEMIPAVIVVDRAADETFLAQLRSTATLTPLLYPSVEQGLSDLKAGMAQVMMAADKESGGPGLGLEITLYYDKTDQAATIAAARVRDFLEGYL